MNSSTGTSSAAQAPESSVATFHFAGALNDFLLRRRRNTAVVLPFTHRASIKDMIEALGVPHPEVAVVVVNGVPVGWDYIVKHQDTVAVYPASAAPDVPAALRVEPPALATPRFVLDVHLGRLASFLRLLGFDTCYHTEATDSELARISADEQRILLTRDRHLLKRAQVVYGYYVRATEPRQQVVEVVRRFELAAAVTPYRRCSRCNGLLDPVGKAAIAHRLEPQTRAAYDDFQICRECEQVYWLGSHVERLQPFIDHLAQLPQA